MSCMGKRYDLGVMDLYPIAVMGTGIEDSPTVGVTLDENVDAEQLRQALLKTVELFPLFKTRIVFDKGYFLEENNNPVMVFHEDDIDRTFTWKSGTNDYPWKLSFFENRILLRWCHAVTDGRGAETFLGALLHFYYDLPYSIEPELELGLEAIADSTEKGIKQKKQPDGFGRKALKLNPSDQYVSCHVLKCRTADVLALSKRSNASPVTIIPPLFSRALRNCMAEKRNVKFNIPIDMRVPSGHKTMHNCITQKAITYIDRFDSMDFELVATIYRAILNLACEKENIAANAAENVKMIGLLVKHRSKTLISLIGKICAKVMKNTDSDAVFSYLGKIDYGEVVNQHIRDYIFCSWPDFGYCSIGATDFEGVFTMYVNEAYEDKRVVPEFLKAAKALGLEIRETDSYQYYRADRIRSRS